MARKAPLNSIALIPDGNRRWATSHKLSFLRGYSIGVEKFIRFSEWCKEFGVRNVTVWAFSTENIKRPKKELSALFSIYRRAAKDKKILARLHANKTRFNVIGDKDLLPKDLVNSLAVIERETSKYKERVINMLIGYGGKYDILAAVKKIAAEASIDKRLAITEELFRRSLPSYSVPDIDLVIRTSGEERLSGFMPWQAGYAELIFPKKYWPEFTKSDLKAVMHEYDRRQRRFGV